MWTDEKENNILVAGHRGMAALYPENTIISFKAALDARVDLIEFDVHFTKDKRLVVCHDPDIERTTDGRGKICDMTLAELQTYDAGVKKSARFAGERIPTLEEVLPLMAGCGYDVLLNVEIKDYQHELVDATIAMLKAFQIADRCVIACFNAEIVDYTHQTYPEMKTQGFPERVMRKKTPDDFRFTDEFFLKMYGVGIPLYSDEKTIKEDVAFAKKYDLKRWLYCADDEAAVIAAIENGATNITSNDPYVALRYLIKHGLHTPLENKALTGRMHAANLHAAGDLRYEQVELPCCGDDEVLVQVKNCGICGTDIGRVLKKGTYHFPTIPGHEFSGKVVYDQSGAYTGKRVAVFPLLPCFRCEGCQREQYAQCTDYDYYGSRRDGGFAEYIAVKRFNLIELPDNVTYEEGAMCEPLSVARHAVKKLALKKGDQLLITGAGPIGLMAGMWARSFGAGAVYYIDIDSQKTEFCKRFGFEEYDGAARVDAVLEGSGASDAIARAIRAVKPGGKIVLMGNPGGDVTLSSDEYQTVLRKELQLIGTWNSSYAKTDNDWVESLKALSEERINIRGLITHRISLKACDRAIRGMQTKQEFYCKEIVENEK